MSEPAAIGFRAAADARSAGRPRRAEGPLRACAVRSGRRHRGARRRRLHARDPARRIERPVPIYGMNLGTVGFLLNTYQRGRPAGASGQGRPGAAPSAAHARPVPQRPGRARPRDQRGLAVPPDPPGGQSAHRDRWRDTPRAAGVRRHPGRHRRRQHRLQSVGARADPAGRRQPAGAHPDQRVPPAALARRPAAEPQPVPHQRGRSDKRPVSAVADYTEIRDVVEVRIWEDRAITLTLLFDPEHNLEERILKEQFVP